MKPVGYYTSKAFNKFQFKIVNLKLVILKFEITVPIKTWKRTISFIILFRIYNGKKNIRVYLITIFKNNFLLSGIKKHENMFDKKKKKKKKVFDDWE